MLVMNCLFLIFISLLFYHLYTIELKKLIVAFVVFFLLTSSVIVLHFSYTFTMMLIYIIYACVLMGKSRDYKVLLIVVIYAGLTFGIRTLDMTSMTLKYGLLCFSTCLSFIIFVCYLKCHKVENKLFVLLLIIIFYPMLYMSQLYVLDHIDFNSIITIVGILVSNYMVLYILYKIVMFEDNQAQLQLSKQREDQLEIKYNSMKQHYESQFNFIHHLLHQCSSIQEAMNMEDYKRAKKQLDEVSNEIFNEFNILYSNAEVLNYILSEHMDQIKQYDICIRTSISYDDFSFLTLDVQMALFESLLAHAIQFQKVQTDPHYIGIKTKKVHHQILMQCIYGGEKDVEHEEIVNQMKTLLAQHHAFVQFVYDEDLHLNKVLISFS